MEALVISLASECTTSGSTGAWHITSLLGATPPWPTLALQTSSPLAIAPQLHLLPFPHSSTAPFLRTPLTTSPPLMVLSVLSMVSCGRALCQHCMLCQAPAPAPVDDATIDPPPFVFDPNKSLEERVGDILAIIDVSSEGHRERGRWMTSAMIGADRVDRAGVYRPRAGLYRALSTAAGLHSLDRATDDYGQHVHAECDLGFHAVFLY